MKKRSLLYENSEETPLINLTPLIDVVFVLLIGCIIAATFINIQNISLAEGHGSTMECSVKDIIISVYKDHSILLNQKLVSFLELEIQLKELKKISPNSIPLLIQDGETSFRLYQKIKSTIENVGFNEFDVALLPE